MNRNPRAIFTAGRAIFLIYFIIWAVLVVGSIPGLAGEGLYEIIMNAVIISMFVGLGLNVNAFSIRNYEGRYLTLLDRYRYVLQHFGNVAGFFIIPFCVSSASSIIARTEDANILAAVFGGGSYLQIIALGFIFFLLVPVIYVVLRYGVKSDGGH